MDRHSESTKVVSESTLMVSGQLGMYSWAAYLAHRPRPMLLKGIAQCPNILPLELWHGSWPARFANAGVYKVPRVTAFIA